MLILDDRYAFESQQFYSSQKNTEIEQFRPNNIGLIKFEHRRYRFEERFIEKDFKSSF